MIISEISIRGFKSYGNNESVLKLNTNSGELILLMGGNGSGKSVIPSTNIDVDVKLEKLTLEELTLFLGIMGEEKEYIEYIKENNYLLYEQYINK